MVSRRILATISCSIKYCKICINTQSYVETNFHAYMHFNYCRRVQHSFELNTDDAGDITYVHENASLNWSLLCLLKYIILFTPAPLQICWIHSLFAECECWFSHLATYGFINAVYHHHCTIPSSAYTRFCTICLPPYVLICKGTVFPYNISNYACYIFIM